MRFGRTFRTRALLTALVLASALETHAQAPPDPAPKPIELEVTWTLVVSGYESQARIVLQASYEVHPWKEFKGGGDWGGSLPTAVCGGAAEASCFVLKHRGGRLVSSGGKNSAGDLAIFTEEADEPQVGVGPDGLIRPTAGGFIEILFYRRPRFQAENMAAEEALGCWSADWPTLKISDAELRNLGALRRPWEIPAMDAEGIAVAPGCEPGSARVEIRAAGRQECEPLKTACERAERWFNCARRNVGNLLGQMAQTKAEVAAERAARRSQFPAGVADPEAAGYQQLDTVVDRLMQQVLAWQTNLLTGQATVRADCALLPGPQAEKECQDAARRVEEATRKSQEELNRDLEREVLIFESSTAGAPSSLARTKLLAQLRATLVSLRTCQAAM